MSGVCDKRDAGFGWLDLIDHARLQPGLVVRMHEHRNDIHLSADGSIDLPMDPSFDRWLYIFRDAVSVGDYQTDTYTALTISAHQTAFEVTASREADIILFLVNQQAPFSRAATLSG
jgi:redox-sensitive bicupin YhaK (pirin superfamily)